MRPLLVAMLLLHIGHVIAFRVGAEEQLTEQLLAWRHAVVYTHAATVLVVALLALGAWLLPARAMRWLTPLAAASYLVHGAAIAGADQLNTPTTGPYMAFSFVIAVVLVMPTSHAIGVYLLGTASLLLALYTMQPDPEVRRFQLPHGPTTAVTSVVMLWYFWNARRRDFRQRSTIATQQAELGALNQQLEMRVVEQVEEIVARADEVERLNAQLRAQVNRRTRQLSEALEQLGQAVPDDSTDLLGQVLAGRFELQRVVGRGGMGEVYAGADRDSGRPVAVKLIRTEHSARVEALQRFLQEAEAVAKLGHPAVVRMLHVDVTDDGALFQVQELVDGVPMSEVLQDRLTLPAAMVARLCAVLAEALAAAHAERMVHRDVKPSNVMLIGTYPGLKLLDFGIAKVIAEVGADPDEESSLSTPRTRTGLVVGSPGYMSPEQRMGARDVGDRADIYALGVLGYRSLTGMPPAYGTEPQVPDSGSPLVPDLLELFARCLSIKPELRPSAAEVAAELHALAEAVSAPALQMQVRALQLQAEPSKGA